MAEQAQKEPTMEEILASIRKIIADDDGPVQPKAEARAPDLDVFGDEVSDDDHDDVSIETEDDVLAAISRSMDELEDEFGVDPVAADGDFDEGQDEEFGFEAIEDDEFESFASPEDNEAADDGFDPVDDLDFTAEELTSAEDLVDAPKAEAQFVAPDPAPAFKPVMQKEPVMNPNGPLADAKTVDAAAGALGKLLSKVEFGEAAGGNNTIEGLVREMMRPMLKEWLDDNLPAIVEKHVEAEVRRIARMAG